eukprot:scaffold4908_cov109-Isochrysis_galbana.AAC.3
MPRMAAALALPRRSFLCSWISCSIARSGSEGTSSFIGSVSPVSGAVSCVSSQAAMACRSYTWPSMVDTGSRITSPVSGQRSTVGVGSSRAVLSSSRAEHATDEAREALDASRPLAQVRYEASWVELS